MTVLLPAQPRVAASPRDSVLALARIEALRMMRSPLPYLGIAGSVALAISDWEQTWASAIYQMLLSVSGLMMLAASITMVYSFGREHVAVSEEAPLSSSSQAVARLLGGLSLVGLVAVVVASFAMFLRIRGGLPLGDEPGHTDHAYYSLPELIQPVMHAGLAVALGAAVVHVVRSKIVASVIVFVFWFLVGMSYWIFNGSGVNWVTAIQVQPIQVQVGPWNADPTTFPSSWLLSVPGEYQEGWDRLIVSPALAAWHDVYLVGVIAVLVAVAVPRFRRVLLAGGVVVCVAAVLMQSVVSP